MVHVRSLNVPRGSAPRAPATSETTSPAANAPAARAASGTPAAQTDGFSGTARAAAARPSGAALPPTLALAHAIETGARPLSNLQDRQRSALLKDLSAQLDTTGRTRAALMTRSAAATVLLELATTARGNVRDRAAARYVDALCAEKDRGLRASMLNNLQAAGLPLTAAEEIRLAPVREEVLPTRPPYDRWFGTSDKPRFVVHHHVMDEFYKPTLRFYREQGFEVVREKEGRVELMRVLKDPSGRNPDVTARVTLLRNESDIFRDMKDPEVHMLVYSGHSQLGGIVSSSLATAPRSMEGHKLIQLYQCRGKQTAGDVQHRFPGAHIQTTFDSACDSDDQAVLAATFGAVARRADYAQLRRDIARADLLQPTHNYILPDDARCLAYRDTDRDGLADVAATHADRLFDPQRRRTGQGTTSFTPRAFAGDVQALPGEDLGHALGYANTAFFYFAEANRAAPLTKPQADRFVAAGYHAGTPDDPPLRITTQRRDGHAYQHISINAAYAHLGRGALTALTVMELQKHLCIQDHGAYTEADRLRGLMLVGNYADLFLSYAEECDAVVKAAAAHAGITGASYEALFAASVKDGEHGVASNRALEHLRQLGVRAPE